MPRQRPEPSIWAKQRRQAWETYGGLCQGPYCRGKPPLPLSQVQIDHQYSGKLANNAQRFLRPLCKRCHALRLDYRHRGLIVKALQQNLIPPDWRQFLWDNDHWPSEEIVAAMIRWETTQKERG